MGAGGGAREGGVPSLTISSEESADDTAAALYIHTHTHVFNLSWAPRVASANWPE